MKAGIILYALFTIASQQLVLEHRAWDTIRVKWRWFKCEK
jgi:hypothetical protein